MGVVFGSLTAFAELERVFPGPTAASPVPSLWAYTILPTRESPRGDSEAHREFPKEAPLVAQPLPWAFLGLCLLKLPKEMTPLQAMATAQFSRQRRLHSKTVACMFLESCPFLPDCQIRRHTVVHSIFLQFVYFSGIR